MALNMNADRGLKAYDQSDFLAQKMARTEPMPGDAKATQMSNLSRGRVLVVGDDMRIFLAVARSLGRAGYAVHAAPFNWRAPALASRYISQTHFLTRYSDNPEAWLAEIKAVVTQNDLQVVIPCCDRAILPLDRHRAELGPAILAIPGQRAMETLFDKAKTKALAETLDIPVSPGEQLTSSQSASELIARFGLPVVIKPKRSYSIDHLTTWGRVYIAESLQELTTILASVNEPERYLVEKYFKGGVGVGVSVLARRGEIIQAFQHRRLREGWGGSSSLRVSEDCDPALLEAATRICAAMQIHGVCMFEFRRNAADGSWILLEVNARLWGSVPLPVGMGVDFPRALCELLLDRPLSLPVPYKAGVRSRNTVLDGWNLLNATRHGRFENLRAGLLAWTDYLAQPIWWVVGREHSDSFTLDDPAPGFAEIWDLLKRIARRDSSEPDRRPGDKSATVRLAGLIRPAT